MAKADTAQDVLMYAFAPNEEVLKANMGAVIKEANIGDVGVTPTSGTIDLGDASQTVRRLEFDPGFPWELIAIYISFSTTTPKDIRVYYVRGTDNPYQIVNDTANGDNNWRMKASPGTKEENLSTYKLRVDFSQAAATTATPHIVYRRIS